MPGIATKEVSFDLPGHSLNLLVVQNVEELITDPTDEDKVPCWAEIWPSARGLAHWLWRNMKFNQQPLLELGSGLGLGGLVCGLLGAQVTFSDFNLSALELARLNATRNGLTNFNINHGDWRDFKLKQKFPWVLGSDIFYSPRLNQHLLQLIPGLVTPGGSLIMAHPGRPATFEFVQQLKGTMPLQEQAATVPVTIEDDFFPYYNIQIHVLKFL